MTWDNMGEAQANFRWLKNNPYTGRGIVMGSDQTGTHVVQIYWIMSRSDPNKNRALVKNGSQVNVELADPSRPGGKPELTIYAAMREVREVPYAYIVSNGDQTETVFQLLDRHGDLIKALRSRTFEDDPPNFTQRITALLTEVSTSSALYQFAILRKSRYGLITDASWYRYFEIEPGYGLCITTYEGDGNPLSPFRGDPRPMPLRGTVEQAAQTYWDALNPAHRISLVAKFIRRSDGASKVCIINEYSVIR